MNLKAAGREAGEEVVADKGYHAAETLELCEHLGLRTYIPEPDAGTSGVGPTSRPSFNARSTTIAAGCVAPRASSCAPTQRSLRTDFRPPLRLGRDAAKLAARTGERNQTLPDRRRRDDLGASSASCSASASRRPSRADSALPRLCSLPCSPLRSHSQHLKASAPARLGQILSSPPESLRGQNTC